MSENKKKCSPTLRNFNPETWVSEWSNTENVDDSFIKSGLIFGHLIKKIDDKFDYIISKHGTYSEHEVAYFQQHATLEYFLNGSHEEAKQINVNQLMESIVDGTKLMLKSSSIEFNERKPTKVYHELLKLASERLYLMEQWRKVELGRYKLDENLNYYYFRSSDNNLDFGEIIAVQRFADHLHQLQYEFRTSPETIPLKISEVPSYILAHTEGFEVEFKTPDSRFMEQAYLLYCQIPFYYEELCQVKFEGYPEVTIIDLVETWLVLSSFATAVITSEYHQRTGRSYQAVDSDFLISVIARCRNISVQSASQALSIFSVTRDKIEDFYLTPILVVGSQYFISLPVLISGQFTRVVDYHLQKNVLGTKIGKKKYKKGKFFENHSATVLSHHIEQNQLLQSNFCKVLKVGYKQPKGKKNEEIDIVLRIGKTYLLIEAKSFIYRVGSVGFENNLNTIRKSKFEQKKAFFIDDFLDFKEKYDPNYHENKIEDENIVSCYLTSSPHCVGMKVNDVPVVDMSVLERYFGNGDMILLEQDGVQHRFPFYTTQDEAEKNLRRYLNNPPPLERFKQSHSYLKTSIGEFEGKAVNLDSAFFNLKDMEETICLKLIESSSTWFKNADS